MILKAILQVLMSKNVKKIKIQIKNKNLIKKICQYKNKVLFYFKKIVNSKNNLKKMIIIKIKII